MSELTTANQEWEKLEQILEKAIPPAIALVLLWGIANTPAGEVAPRAAAAVEPNSSQTALVGTTSGEAGISPNLGTAKAEAGTTAHEKSQMDYFKDLTKEFVTFAKNQHPNGSPVVALTEPEKNNILNIIAKTGSGLVDLGLDRAEVERVIKYLTVAVINDPNALDQSMLEWIEIHAINPDAARHELLHQFLELKSDTLNTNAIKEGIAFRIEAQLLAGDKSAFVANSPFYAASCKTAVSLKGFTYQDAGEAIGSADAALRANAKIKDAKPLEDLALDAYRDFAYKIPDRPRWGDPMPDLFMFNYVGTKMGVSANEVQKAFLTEPLFACK